MLLLQSSLHKALSLSYAVSYSTALPSKIPTLSIGCRGVTCFQGLSVTCSISKIHSYGTVDYERRPIVRWNDIYKRISLMQNPEIGSAAVLEQWEDEGKSFTKWELCRVIKELRKYKRYKRALEVYGWMNNKPERFSVSSSDAAIQLDLISKVHGVSSAEEYFLSLADKLTDRRTYGALLNVYVRYRMKEKAEALFDKMRSKGYAVHSLPFNVMMTLYVNLKVYDKVDMLASEMRGKNIRLDIYSYNIWLSSCGSRGSIEKMEEVFDQMVKDPKIVPNWTTFSTMATMYINMNMFEKAVGCLRKVESRIKGRDRVPFHYLLSLYGSVGKKDDVYRVWSTYKSMFATIPNLGYHAIIASLVKLDDIEGAEKIYEEWLSTSSTYDPRITNLLIGCYVKKGNTDKALGFFRQMTEGGGIPNSKTWEIICSGHIADERISDALSCFKEAFVADVLNKWRPRATNFSAFFKLCQDKDDTTSAEVLTGLLRQSRFIKNEVFVSLIGLSESDGTINNGELWTEVDTADITDDNDDGENAVDDSQMFNQLESTL
ncbi:hypothetical protein HN51_050645 [Arachis hypogaea]|uniref:Pentatricopeptide repeat-containing protein n=1 Tax=Arachis hypogaea TaxID=3818 RepID=A0A444YAM3_ARAHY|nr:pentatricopeptide repeat-containing protein At1g02150 [Arachis ipaensis]XP_025666854.1 pentatricopeptide repeat-containing protein At1g02150 [Arachis hypogaea]QHN92424.1 Pentatricopeptide repeat-containing protein [Arachis hypogaea]RYQ98887.1 hypothetical protein Ahy_B07g086709 [Arachis hypogaea]